LYRSYSKRNIRNIVVFLTTYICTNNLFLLPVCALIWIQMLEAMKKQVNRNKAERRNDFLSSKEGHRMTYHKHRIDIRDLTIPCVEKEHL